MSLIVKFSNGAELHQCGVYEIPRYFSKNIDLIVFSAVSIQPRIPLPKKYVCTPLKDSESLSLKEIKFTLNEANRIAEMCAQKIRNGEKILTTCYAGRNRSGLISALILLKVTNLNPDQVIALIRKRRKRNALSNKIFVKLITCYPSSL